MSFSFGYPYKRHQLFRVKKKTCEIRGPVKGVGRGPLREATCLMSTARPTKTRVRLSRGCSRDLPSEAEVSDGSQ